MAVIAPLGAARPRSLTALPKPPGPPSPGEAPTQHAPSPAPIPRRGRRLRPQPYCAVPGHDPCAPTAPDPPVAAPVTLKSLLTKTWCGPLVANICTAYEPSLSCSTRLTVPEYPAASAAALALS